MDEAFFEVFLATFFEAFTVVEIVFLEVGAFLVVGAFGVEAFFLVLPAGGDGRSAEAAVVEALPVRSLRFGRSGPVEGFRTAFSQRPV